MKKIGQSFSVILIDSSPLFEGRSLLSSLSYHGIPCTYGLLPSLPSLLARTDLVLLGTNAVLGDGACYSRAGTASVAMLAKGMSKPVLVCSETYKFVEKIQLDPLVANELGASLRPAFDPCQAPTLTRRPLSLCSTVAQATRTRCCRRRRRTRSASSSRSPCRRRCTSSTSCTTTRRQSTSTRSAPSTALSRRAAPARLARGAGAARWAAAERAVDVHLHDPTLACGLPARAKRGSATVRALKRLPASPFRKSTLRERTDRRVPQRPHSAAAEHM